MTPDPPGGSFDDDPAFQARGDAAPGRSGAAATPASRPTLPPLTLRPGQPPLLDIFPESATLPAPSESPSRPRETALPPTAAPPSPTKPRGVAEFRPIARPRGAFYAFGEPPFTLTTEPRFLYHSAAYDAVAQDMLHAIGQRHSFVLLTGDIGLGKTITCRAVLDQLDHRTLTSFIAIPFESTEHLLKTVLVDFGVVSRAEAGSGRLDRASIAELTLAIRDFLHSLRALDAFAVIVVDEAQNLPDEALEQLRLLSESGEGRPLLQVVLVGPPQLRARLARPALKALNERIAIRCVQRPLATDEVPLYVAHRLHVATAAPTVAFDEGAIERLQALSLGVPRAINLMCERALAHGRALEVRVIGASLIERAAQELGIADAPSPKTPKRGLLVALLLLVLVAVGAGVAVYLFRAEPRTLFENW